MNFNHSGISIVTDVAIARYVAQSVFFIVSDILWTALSEPHEL